MGGPTVDQQNPGSRKVQEYNVGGGLAGNVADDRSLPTDFLLLKDCLVDKRVGAVLKRPGSVAETIASSLGVPTGIGEYIVGNSGSIPITRTLLMSFGGTTWYSNQAGIYASVAVDSLCNFSTSRQFQSAKIGSNLFIAGGLPAKWGGLGTEIERVGIKPPPNGPPTFVATISSGSITLTEGCRYMYTHYNTITGVESDWSELSIIMGPATDVSIIINIPGATDINWDAIRIYRTFDGGAFPYFVDQVSSSGDYTDTKTDAELTFRAADRYSRLPPPQESYICAKYAQCMWYVDAADPYKLVFSTPYTGSDADLEYFPIDNYVIANDPITALYVIPGKLLVFHPRSISYVSGFSIDDFVFQPYIPGTGTLFANSITSNGKYLFFLGEQGIVGLPMGGGMPRHLSREIDHDLQPLLTASYNSAIYVSSAWNPSLRQFIFMISAQSTAGAPWEEVGTGSTATAVAGWEDSGTLTTELWEDVHNANSSAAQKVRIWGWSQELSNEGKDVWSEYTFPSIANDNTTPAYPTFLFHPMPSSDTLDPQQDKTYLGYWNGTEGKIRRCFDRSLSTDDGSAFVSELITGRLAPGLQNGGYKLFRGIGFQNSYSDPTADTLATLKYLIDFDDPHLRSYTGSLITISGATDIKKLPTMLGRHIHLYLTDSSSSQSKVLLSQFYIHYHERMRREGR